MSNEPIPSAPGPELLYGRGARVHLLRHLMDPIANAGRLFARYGKVASIIRAPVRVANPGPGWGTGPLATARGAGVETAKPTVYEYNPFSAGPRMCIGAAFATMEIKIALAMMLQRYRLELPEGARIDPRVAITMAPVGGLPMRIRRRTDPMATPARVRGKIHSLVRLN